MRKLLLTLSVFTACIITSLAQTPPPIEWQKCFGGKKNEWPHTIKQTFDGGFIIAGNGGSGSLNHHGTPVIPDYWIVKTDAAGTIVWEKSLGGKDTEENQVYIELIPDGYIVSGTSSSDDEDITVSYGGLDYWIVRLDLDGNIIWQKSLGGENDDIAGNCTSTDDGGFIVTGTSYSNNGLITAHYGGITSSDIWVVKLNANGEVLWDKNYGGSSYDNGTAIAQTIDGGYILSGYTYSNDIDISGNHGNLDYVLIKIDAEGNIGWQKCYGGTSAEYTPKVLEIDGGYILCGYTLSNDGDVSGNHGGSPFSDYWVVKTDVTGNIEWQKCYGGSNSEYSQFINPCGINGYIISGRSYSTDGDISDHHGAINYPDNWVVRIDNAGTIIWQQSLGGTTNEYGGDILQTADGGFAGCTYTISNDGDVSGNHGNADYWLYKLAPEECTVNTDISYTGSLTYCKPGSVILNASTVPGYTYQWLKNGVDIPGATTSAYISSNTSANYQVEISNGICSDISAFISITANKNPVAKIMNIDGVTDLCLDPSIRLKTNSGEAGYQWKKDGLDIPGATAIIYSATTAGNYQVVVTNAEGCSKTSAITSITHSCRQSENISDNGNIDEFNIYPNPASDKLNIIFPSVDNSFTVEIIITNITGEIIYQSSENFSGNKSPTQINLDGNFASGLYTLRLLYADKQIAKQFIVEK